MNERFSSENLITSVFKITDNRKDKTARDLSKESATFMWYQLLTDILIKIPYDDGNDVNGACKEMIDECRLYYTDDESELRKIDDFEEYYNCKQALYWYTCDSFVYRLLNRAFRTENIDVIFKFRSFITDLHQLIASDYAKQQHSIQNPILTVYRGQQLNQNELEVIKQNVNGLIAMNSFLSTTTNRNLAEVFAGKKNKDEQLESILFQIHVDTKITTLPYVRIDDSAEDEILLSMGGIFRIDSVEEENNQWVIDLTLASNDDEDVNDLLEFKRRHYIGKRPSLNTLGVFLSEMGEYDKAEKYFDLLLEQNEKKLVNLTEEEFASILNNCGFLNVRKGNYIRAAYDYENALQIYLNISNQHGSMSTYVNLASLSSLTGSYALAVEYLNKVPNLSGENPLPLEQFDLVIARYVGVGMGYRDCGKFNVAEKHVKSALNLHLKYYPKNDPRTGKLYVNLGLINNDLGRYNEAIDNFKRGLEIYSKSLPPEHPDIGIAYSNFGLSQINYGQYHLGLENLEKASLFSTINDSLKSNIFNNMGLAYNCMNDTIHALEFYQKALQCALIRPEDADFSLIATIYNNIGTIYCDKQEYQQALVQFETALKFQLKSLPSLHSALALTYNNIGTSHYYQFRYAEAMYNYRKAIDIQLETLKWNHPDLAVTYNNIGSVHRINNDIELAKNNFELALEIALQSLPPNHPSVKMYQEQLLSL
ncbi:unnamed protein product [Rotaria sordida]|uniref:Uncharacterized protein n=1 Tax=Rotaria sordida TaxID=392033 RepID=A0A814R1Z2_9BILA|nr:unnamed protein product [Rotaria sordida]CAF1350429.1 unnamed protein product [Rotaria sordida]